MTNNLFKPKSIKKHLVFCLYTLSVVLTPSYGYAQTPQNPQEVLTKNFMPSEENTKVLAETLEKIQRTHYAQKKISKAFSQQILKHYLEQLDPSKLYFNKKYIQSINIDTFHESIQKNSLTPFFEIFNTFHTLYTLRITENLSILKEKPESVFVFNTNETLKTTPNEHEWLTQSELDAHWKKNLTYQALKLKIYEDLSIDQLSEKLIKRYNTRLRYATKVDQKDAFQKAMNAITSSFDPHTEYFIPHNVENFNIAMKLSFEGIGAVLKTEEDYTTIVNLLPGGPAEKSQKLHPQDKILGVAQGAHGEMIDVVGWPINDVVDLIRGPIHSIVRLKIMNTKDPKSSVVTLKRNKIKLEEQAAQKEVLSLGKTKIGIITIPSFYIDFDAFQANKPDYRSTTRDVKKLIEELKKENVEALILDLRNNGGGSLEEAKTLVGLFIEKGPIVQIKNTFSNRTKTLYDKDSEQAWSKPLAVVINRYSASASEIFAGAIQDYQRGLIIGNQSFGKGTIQSLLPLNSGQLKITHGKFYRISGKSTQHMGIVPDLTLPSLSNLSKVGESALPFALHWDEIKPIKFTPTQSITSNHIASLKTYYQTLKKSDPLIQYWTAVSEKLKAQEDTPIHLNFIKLKQEKETHRAWRLNTENKKRIAKKLPIFESIEDLDKYQEEAKEDDSLIDDYITISGKILKKYMILIEKDDQPISSKKI